MGEVFYLKSQEKRVRRMRRRMWMRYNLIPLLLLASAIIISIIAMGIEMKAVHNINQVNSEATK